MPVPPHLTINTNNLPFEELLSDWRWLVSSDFTPVLMTAFGDLFLGDQLGQIHFLDLMSGEFKTVATSREDFDRRCEDREQRRIWFVSFLLTELRKTRGDLETGQCYSCKIPLSLGGQLVTENFERIDLQVHYSVLGQLHRQTKNLPPGTRRDDIEIGLPAAPSAPRKWWQLFRN
jgi:hypothetical protein